MLIDKEIDVEYINSLPTISFSGEIKLIETSQEFEDILYKLSAVQSVGFDTESRPSFVKGKSYPISLVQIATEQKVYIIKLQNTGIPSSFIDFMESKIEKIGVGLNDDIRKLLMKTIFAPKSMVDLSTIAKSKGYSKTSLRVLTARYLKRRLTKSSQKTNWSKAHLSESQLRYAATDAWVSLLIRPLLEADKGVTQ